MQNYDNPKSRNTSSAASGMLPNKVSVPMPGTDAKSHGCGKPGSKVSAPAGFAGGVIPGKI
jgi:hypothetical protein